MEKEELKTLFKKYVDGTCTEEEKALLENWYMQYNEPGPFIGNRKIQAAKNFIFLKLPGNETNFPKIGVRLIAAAVIIGFLITVTLSLLDINRSKPKSNPVADFPPGTNKATLTIGGHQSINLTDALNGTITSKGSIKVVKSKSGQVTYTFAPSGNIDHTPNTVSTP